MLVSVKIMPCFCEVRLIPSITHIRRESGREGVRGKERGKEGQL